VEGTSDLESGGVEALRVERVLGVVEGRRRELAFQSDTTGSVSAQTVRPARRRKRGA